MTSHNEKPASLEINAETGQVTCVGLWTIQSVTTLNHTFEHMIWPETDTIILEGHQLTHIDTAGAWLLSKIITVLKQRQHQVKLTHFTDEQLALLKLVEDELPQLVVPPPPPPINFFEKVGRRTMRGLSQMKVFMTFQGEVTTNVFRWLRHPREIQWEALLKTIETSGYQALPIIGLLSFLIGVVLTYQASEQLKLYGANVYIVNLLGISVLREFSPLITAIIIAGRSGSAFTAQLGTMRINQEIDALQAFGLSPIGRLALQNFFGLIIALPLLTVWSDIMGVLGGMMMSEKMLDVSYYDFICRFQEVILVKHYLLGLVKTPFFAMIIACVGSYQGFQVKGTAESVGTRTTTSVVQAIFFIIIADALFSILFNWYKL